MESKLLRFSEVLKEDKDSRNYISSLDHKNIMMYDSVTTYSFYLSARHNNGFLMSRYDEPLIKLDEEDINYLKNKYLPKINDEFQEELNKLKQRYNK